MTYKKKNIVLLISFVVFLYLSWTLAIQETVELSTALEKTKTELKKIENAPTLIAQLEGELSRVRDQSQRLYSGVLEMREGLYSEISMLAQKHQLSLNRFPNYYSQEKEGIELTTSLLVLSGDFKKMVQLVEEFEKANTSGKISSTLFEVDESPRNKKRSLYLTLYIQSINPK